MKTKAMIITVIVFTLSLFIGVVGAQEENNRPNQTMFRGEVIEIVTEATGLDVSDIREALQDGATLTDIITNNGADVDVIIAEVEAELTSLIETAVENGRITQEMADELLEGLSENITTFFTTTHEFGENDGENPRNRARGAVLANLVEAVTDATGLDVSDIREALQDGATLADIISDSGADVNAITQTVIDTVTTAINERVESGDLTQEQAETILENLESNLTDLMNGDIPAQGRTRGQGRNN